jgi:hypothetical protein
LKEFPEIFSLTHMKLACKGEPLFISGHFSS